MRVLGEAVLSKVCVLWGNLFWAMMELVVHFISSKSLWCVYLRAVGRTASWLCGNAYTGYFSSGWQIINEFVFELVSWS